MSIRNKKKGFTLVELLVVIAIIAILATVSVVGYISLTKKANVSNDTSMTTQMNTVLEATEAEDGSKNATVYEAFQDLEANGITVDNLKTYTDGYKYAWNSTTDRMVLLDESGAVVVGEGTGTNSDLFVPVDSVDELNNYAGIEAAATNDNVVYADSTNPFSVYLTTKFDITTATSITVKAGIDTGKQEVASIKYSGIANVIIRTNSDNAKIEISSGATISVYGKAGEITVSKDEATCKINATVTVVYIDNASISLQSSANIEFLYVNGSSAKIENNGGTVNYPIASSSDVQSSLNVEGMTFEVKGKEEVEKEAAKPLRIGSTCYKCVYVNSSTKNSDGTYTVSKIG